MATCGCNTMTAGIGENCLGAVGGVARVYLTDFCNIDAATLVYNSPDGKISSIPMSVGTYFYEFKIKKGTANFNEVEVADSGLVTQTLSFQIERRQQDKKDIIKDFGKGHEFAVIYRDKNGLNWFLGIVNGVTQSNLESVTGSVAADFNGYTFTFVAEEPEGSNEVLESAVQAVLAP